MRHWMVLGFGTALQVGLIFGLAVIVRPPTPEEATTLHQLDSLRTILVSKRAEVLDATLRVNQMVKAFQRAQVPDSILPSVNGEYEQAVQVARRHLNGYLSVAAVYNRLASNFRSGRRWMWMFLYYLPERFDREYLPQWPKPPLSEDYDQRLFACLSRQAFFGNRHGTAYTHRMEMQQGIFGGGCFWCTEAVFKQLKGVTDVTSGYAGGQVEHPSYEQVSSGHTGHVEVVKVVFDPAVVSYEQLLEVFFLTHDPTQVNRQGNDVGEQYRTVIFTQNDTQRQQAETVKSRIDREKVYDRPIATAIEPLTSFYPAEDYHQDYFEKNPDQPYCQAVINPKVAKLRKKFSHLLTG